MSEPRCDCCDLPVSMCGKAAEQRQRAAEAARVEELLALPGVIAARYSGRCGGCGSGFTEGAPIKRKDGSWVGDCCLD